MNRGLHTARGLLREVLDLGLPIGCEFLDPITPQYISDLVACGAIGARTTESQIHRQLASGLSMPVGFKNGTDGTVKVAVDAVSAAAARSTRSPASTSAARPAILHTEGNPDCHVILRGGRGAPNYEPDAGRGRPGAAARRRACPSGSSIDASHENSGKDHERQPKVHQRDRRPDRGRQRGDRRRDGRVVPGRRPPGPRAETRRWSTASRSPTPAWTGTRPCSPSTAWRLRCASAARRASRAPNAHRRPRGRPDRRLDRARGPQADRRRAGHRLGPRRRAARPRPWSSARSTRPRRPSPRRSTEPEVVFCAAPVGALPSWPPTALAAAGRGRCRHRRRLGQGRGDRRARRGPALRRRPPARRRRDRRASRTPARTSSTARAGT